MSQTIDRPIQPLEGSQRTLAAPLWRLAGVFAIAHVVLILAGFSQEKSVMLTDSAAVVERTYSSGSLARIYTGGYVEALAFVVLLPALIFLGRAFGRRSEGGRWAAQTALAAGVTYVAVTLATGLPAGAAAAYGAHHGLADGGTLAVVDDIRIFAFYLGTMALAVLSLGTGIAVLCDRVMQRWVGWGGVAVGALLLVGLATQPWTDGVNYASLVWMIWWVGVGVALIRRGSAASHDR